MGQNVLKVILVMSGKGGVGKSTVAVNLARAMAQSGSATGLLDADLHGPSLSKLTGSELSQVYSENGKLFPVRAEENLWVLSTAHFLKDPDSPVIWRGPMKHGFLKQMSEEVDWSMTEVLVIDCPPGTGDELLSLTQVFHPAGAVVVSTPQNMALLDARKAIQFCIQTQVPVLGLIENMGTYVCPECGKESPLFEGNGIEKASADFGLPVLAKIAFNPLVLKAGEGHGSLFENPEASAISENFKTLATRVLQQIKN